MASNSCRKEEKEMTQRWLKHTADGYIFGWTESLAKHPDLVEVSEEEVFPERFLKAEQVERVKKTRAARKTKALDLSTDDIPDGPVYNSPELEADASRDLPV
jgi:hypothetical protein